MQTRSTTEIVQFRHPFAIRSNPGAMPAGRYAIHVEEEMLEGISFAAWRRTSMTITRQDPPAGHLRQALPLLPAELEAARAADARSAS
jgi:hypothetical protein